MEPQEDKISNGEEKKKPVEVPPSTVPRNQRRKELRDLNLEVWDGKQDAIDLIEPLDSSFKKNTAFIKRCRVGLIDGKADELVKEVRSLSLEKYLSEIIADVSEGLYKCKTLGDLFTGVEVVSALHQRFGSSFSAPLLSNFLHGIKNPSKRELHGLTVEARAREEGAALERHRTIVRVLIELWLVGVFRQASDAVAAGHPVPDYATKKSSGGQMVPIPLAALKEVLNYDTVDFKTHPVVSMVLKNYASLLVYNEKWDNDDTEEVFLGGLVRRDIRLSFANLFTQYVLAFQRRVQDLARQTRRLERRNENSYLKRGEVTPEQKTEYEESYEITERLVGACENVSKYMGLRMPDLRLVNETEEEQLRRKGGTVIPESDKGIWEHDEQRKFYEEIADLTVLLKQQEEERQQQEQQQQEEAAGSIPEPKAELVRRGKPNSKDHLSDDDFASDDDDEGDQEMNDLDELVSHSKKQALEKAVEDESEDSDEVEFKYAFEDSDQEDEGEGEGTRTAGTVVTELLDKLATEPSRDNIDEIALEFVALNNKATRRRLIEFLTEVPVGNQYKLPFYCRLLATLDPIFHDVTQAVFSYLNNFFFYLLRKRKVKKLISRQQFVIQYICELVKFGLYPKLDTFSKFKLMIDFLDDNLVLSMCYLLDGCGRYLLRKPDSNVLMTKMLFMLEDKMKKKYFTIDLESMMKNAIEGVRPDFAEGPEVKGKVRPVIEQYLRYLVYTELDETNQQQVLNEMKRLDWGDEEALTAMRKLFSKIHKVRYANIPQMASMLKTLSEHHKSFGVMIIDTILEEIRRGLEIASFKMNQQRLAQVRYLGEMYVQGMLTDTMAFETLYHILTFGYPNGKPSSKYHCEIDLPNDFFRIRLVCMFLETPGLAEVLDQGESKKKLDMFLTFLQYYIYTKERMSMDIEFQVKDTFNLLRPGQELYQSAQEATAALNRAIAVANGSAKEAENSKAEEATAARPEQSEEQPEEQPEESEEERLAREKRREERRERARREQAAKQDVKAMEEFERDFGKLMTDRWHKTSALTASTNSAAATRQFDEAVPTPKTLSVSHRVNDTTGRTVGYMFLTKKGGRQQATTMSVPREAKFAVSVMKEKDRLQKEQDRVREIVMRYSTVEESDVAEPKQIVQPEVPSFRYSRKKREKKMEGF